LVEHCPHHQIIPEAPEDNTRYEYEIFERKYITFNKLVKKKKKMDVNEHEKPFNITLIDIKFCISVMVGSSTMSKTL
jgi:hypothetical protein